MFCPQCGANNADNATVCAQCGRNLQVSPPPPPIQPGQPTQPVQPTPYQTPGLVMPPAAPVQNYLVFAILTTILCCPPAGIPAIVYAAQVNGKLQAGDLVGAQQASKNAKLWCLISLGLALAGIVVSVLLFMAGIISGISHSN